ncbi:MAG: cation:proton antiporter [Planctomycetia bacterium]|nr:cation:proton antiporter [Planctomycetia bacterium]
MTDGPAPLGVILLAAGREEALRPLLIQLIVIILAARAGAVVARWLRQPSVVGEIVAGLLLGPSAFGAWAPGLFAAIFRGGSGGAGGGVMEASLTSFSQVGLVLLLFLIGIEFDFSHVRRQGRLAGAISVAGIAAPFTLGVGLALLMAPRLDALGASGPVDVRAFALFMGTAMSITAIPILGRILIEMGMQHTPLGATVVAAAACDDAVGWTLLAAVSALASGHFEGGRIVQMAAATLAFAALCLFVVRPLLLPILERGVRDDEAASHGRLSLGLLSLLLSLLLVAAWITSWIGIFAIFGAFLLGASLSGSPRVREAVTGHLTDFVTVFFLPIFFTYTGLRTNIGSLGTPEAWGWCLAVMAVAVLGKWGGCGLAARFGGLPPGEASCVGVLMNTRALMELIVINVGIDLGVIPPPVACMLVLMAIGTTLMTTPLATWLLKGSQYEPILVARGFVRG